MSRNYREIYKQLVQILLFTSVLICSFPVVSFSQSFRFDESSVVIPEQAMEQVVRRVLVFSFKPRNRPTVIYLAEQRIKQSWLPAIKNIEFRILPTDEIEKKNLEVYFFTNPELLDQTYRINLTFGTPKCDHFGEGWFFRIAKNRVRLWQSRGWGGGCGIARKYSAIKTNLTSGRFLVFH